MEFLDNAHKIEKETIRHCHNFPKSFFFYITIDMLQFGRQIYEFAKAANKIYPTDKNEYLKRKEYINDSLIACDNLLGQIDIARDLITHTKDNKKVDSSIWEDWIKLIYDEEVYLIGLKEEDKARFKNLK